MYIVNEMKHFLSLARITLRSDVRVAQVQQPWSSQQRQVYSCTCSSCLCKNWNMQGSHLVRRESSIGDCLLQYWMSNKENRGTRRGLFSPHTSTVGVIKLNQHIEIWRPSYQLRGAGIEVCATFKAAFNWCPRFSQKNNLAHSCSLLRGTLLIAWSWQWRCIQHSVKCIILKQLRIIIISGL